MEVIRSVSTFRGEAPLGMWIRRIAISKALMFLRSAWHSRGQSLDDDWEEMTFESRGLVANSGRQDQVMDLDVALASLPEISRTVVWLHDVEGFTHKEIADLMGRTESFSKSQLSRAYQRLRPLLDEDIERVEAKPGMQESLLGSC